MSRFTVVSARRAALAGAAFALALLAGCASDAARMSDIRYDLGPIDSGGFAAAPASGTVLKVLDMRAPDAFDTDKFVYRLAYADAQRIATYRDSRWTAPPAQLLTQRIRHRVLVERAVHAPQPLVALARADRERQVTRAEPRMAVDLDVGLRSPRPHHQI